MAMKEPAMKEPLLGSAALSDAGSEGTTTASTTSANQAEQDAKWDEMLRKNDYRWMFKGFACYFATVGGVAIAVKVLGNAVMNKLFLAILIFTACAMTAISVTGWAKRRRFLEEDRLLDEHSFGGRCLYRGLCVFLGWMLFYTTGLSFVFSQFLYQTGFLPEQTSWVWTLLFPMKSFVPPTTGAGVLALGAQVYHDIMPYVFPSILLEAFIVTKVVPHSSKLGYSAGDSFLSMVIFVLPLYVATFVMFDWGTPVYNYVHNHLRVTDAFADDESVVGFWLALVASDFFYYVAHRVSHIMSWMWTQHSVHHSCESFNLTNGPREGNLLTHFTPIILFDFIPLAFFFPFSVANPCAQVKLVWNFWFHAVLVPPCPTMELLFNTPSLHRVHHAKNEGRLGKNYGAIFSVWDHLYGTNEPEIRHEGEVRDDIYYGVIPTIQSWDGIWMNIQPWWDMFTRQVAFNGLLSPMLHWTPHNSKCPKLGSRLNPKEENPNYPRSQTWLLYAMFEMVLFSYFGFWLAALGPMQSNVLSEAVGVWHSHILLSVALGGMGLWSASSLGRVMCGESRMSWLEESIRQILLVGGLAVYVLFLEEPDLLKTRQMYLGAYALTHAAAIYALYREVPAAGAGNAGEAAACDKRACTQTH
jgi:sterol desaturase/sphingolipid hydroxylase (fatty acid hydroxylase superfamily)